MKLHYARFPLILGALTVGYIAYAQMRVRPHDSEERVATWVGTNTVHVTVTGGERIITANGWPDHRPGDFPRPGNPNSISTQNYNFHLPTHPEASAKPTTAGHALFGVAL